MKKVDEKLAPSLRGRAFDLVLKALAFKALPFWVGTVLLIFNKIDALTWLATAGFAVGARVAEKRLWQKEE